MDSESELDKTSAAGVPGGDSPDDPRWSELVDKIRALPVDRQTQFLAELQFGEGESE